jgi:hypothetical protein
MPKRQSQAGIHGAPGTVSTCIGGLIAVVLIAMCFVQPQCLITWIGNNPLPNGIATAGRCLLGLGLLAVVVVGPIAGHRLWTMRSTRSGQ